VQEGFSKGRFRSVGRKGLTWDFLQTRVNGGEEGEPGPQGRGGGFYQKTGGNRTSKAYAKTQRFLLHMGGESRWALEGGVAPNTRSNV